MLALCLMLSVTYYAQNYASIIGWSLHTDKNTFSLQHYLNNTSKYFVSHNQFHFMQGQYYINNDLIIKDVLRSFTIPLGTCKEG